jgi:hypothetical protein
MMRRAEEGEKKKTITDGLSWLCVPMTQHYMDEQIFEKSLCPRRRGIETSPSRRRHHDNSRHRAMIQFHHCLTIGSVSLFPLPCFSPARATKTNVTHSTLRRARSGGVGIASFPSHRALELIKALECTYSLRAGFASYLILQ